MTKPKKAGPFDRIIRQIELWIKCGCAQYNENPEAEKEAGLAIAVLKAAADIPYGFVENICDEPEGAQFYRLLKPIFHAIRKAQEAADEK